MNRPELRNFTMRVTDRTRLRLEALACEDEVTLTEAIRRLINAEWKRRQEKDPSK